MTSWADRFVYPDPSTDLPRGTTALSSTEILTASSLAKSFGDRAVLRGVDLTLRSGEMYVLLGPNGAGKTTLMHALCGRLQADAGSVRICGENPHESATARRRIGLVPQQIALYPYLTIRENLSVLGRLAGLRRADCARAVEEALEWIDLADRANDRIDRLSGGMQRRVNLAAGVLHRPELLLLDEPTVGVDPEARDRLHLLLKSLRESGLAILMSTHDMEQAEQLATRTGVLNEGRILVEGTVEGLVRDHFGQQRELTLRMTQPPSDQQREMLAQVGLEASDSPQLWSGSFGGGLERLAAVGEQLERHQIQTDELRLREPGLREVYFKATGKEYRA